MKVIISKIYREPFTYFVLLGAVVYWLYVPKISEAQLTASKIELPAEFIQQKKLKFERDYKRPPTTKEIEQILADEVNDEVLFREAWRLNLYVGDEVVRKRMIQKARYILEESAGSQSITEPEIHQRLTEYNLGPKTIHFFAFEHQLFTDYNKAKTYLVKLNTLNQNGEAKPNGVVSFALGNTFANISTKELEAKMGPGFSGQLDLKNPNQWQGPVKSIYGYHVVKISNIENQNNEDEVQAREMIKQQFAKDQSDKTWLKRLDKVKQRYTIVQAQ